MHDKEERQNKIKIEMSTFGFFFTRERLEEPHKVDLTIKIAKGCNL